MRLPLVFIIACIAALALPATSLAAATLTNVKLTPSTTTAGGHPDVTVDLSFDENPTSDDVKSITVILPQGLSGDPNAPDKCAAAKFTADQCAATTKVGTTTASAIVTVPPGIDMAQDVPGDVYNLQPQPGEPARLGVVLRPSAIGVIPLDKVFLQSGVTTGPDTGFGLKTTFDNLPRQSGGLDIRLTGMKLVLNSKAAHGQFVSNPTDCRPAVTTASITTYDAPNTQVSKTSSFNPTDCDKLPFEPTLSGLVGGANGTAQNNSPTLVTTISTRTGDANPVRAQVSLPPEVGLNLGFAGKPCTPDQFQSGSCPDASRVGTAVAASPLLSTPLTGPVSIVTDPATKVPGLGVQFGPPVPLRLLGSVQFTSGPLTNIFDGIPDLPLARFELIVNGGGKSGLLSNKTALCKLPARPTAKATLVSHSGKTVNLTSPFEVIGCVPGSQTVAGGGTFRPKGKLSLKFKHALGKLSARFTAAKSEKLRRARLALPSRLGLGLRGKKLPRLLKVTADGHRLGRKVVHVKGHTLDVKLGGKGAKSVAVSWGALKPKGSLARKLKRRPRLTFVANLTDVTGRTTKLRLTVRPAVRR